MRVTVWNMDDDGNLAHERFDWKAGETMPVSRDTARKSAKKKTLRGKRKQREVGKSTSGLRNRRLKRG